ncbi:MAG: polysaccharide deacetylase family protein, partial [Turicibacter sp.]
MRNSLFDEKLNTRLKSFLFLIFGVILMALFCMNMITIKAATVDDRIEHFIYQDPKPEKVVYLTFDDGPSKYTLDLLNLLDKEDISAIFFVIGENIDLLSNADEVLNEV